MRKAEDIFNKIGKGIDEAVERPSDSREDRRLRRLIEVANNNGDLIIPTEDGCYYRPDLSKDYERANVNSYLNQERKRMESIELKYRKMRETYNLQMQALEA